PSLLDESLLAVRCVFDEAVAINVAIAIDPFQGEVDMGAQVIEKLHIAGVLEVASGEHEEERCTVDAAVVTAKRNFAEIGHFSAAGFVQDFAGLSFVLEINFGRLGRCQKLENSFSDVRSNP